jgi:hypothetical protein
MTNDLFLAILAMDAYNLSGSLGTPRQGFVSRKETEHLLIFRGDARCAA